MLKMLNLFMLAAILLTRPGMAAESTDADPNRKELHRAMQEYEDAFNRADADQLAACWTEDGQYATASGARLEGPDAIRKAYAKLFAEKDGLRLQTIASRSQTLAPSVVLEEGVVRVIAPNEPPTEARYEAIHVKKDGKWKLSRVRETIATATGEHRDQLKELQWMVGRWATRDGTTSVRSECEWTSNGHYLRRSFSVKEAAVEIDVTQYIGWDASTRQIRSWSFDSEGGFEQAVWRQVDDQWTVDVIATLPDGRQGSAERILKPVDDDSYRWRSVNRQIAGRLLPSLDEVTVVRTKDTSK